MKKQLFFLMLIAGCMLAFTGCSKDDDDASIEGRWNAKSEIGKYSVNGVEEIDEDTYAPGEYEIAFNDGKFVEYYEGEVDDEGSYSVSGDKLTYDYGDGDKEVVTIKTLNSNTLVLFSEYNYTDGGITYSGSEETTFTR